MLAPIGMAIIVLKIDLLKFDIPKFKE